MLNNSVYVKENNTRELLPWGTYPHCYLPNETINHSPLSFGLTLNELASNDTGVISASLSLEFHLSPINTKGVLTKEIGNVRVSNSPVTEYNPHCASYS